jgi:hypothetical protein
MAATFRLVKSETVPLTDEVLETFRALPASPTERVFKESRAKHLESKVLAGNAIPFIWAKAQYDGKEYRMNGQHSSAMLADLNGQRPEGLMVHLDTYAVDDGQGLVRLFRQFDDRKSMRDAADVAGAYQMLESELKDLQTAHAKRAIEGIAWYDRYVQGVPTPVGDDQYALFHDVTVHPFLKWTDGIYDIKTKELEKVPIHAAMWGTFTTNQAMAQSFWGSVARAGKLEDDSHPTTKLDEWLRSIAGKETIGVKTAEIYQGCIFAWNAYRRDAQVVKIKYDTSKGFMTIAS